MNYINVNTIVARLKDEIDKSKDKLDGLMLITNENPDNLSYCMSIQGIAKKNNYFKNVYLIDIEHQEDWKQLVNCWNPSYKIFIMDGITKCPEVLDFIKDKKQYVYSETIEGCVKITPTPDSIIDICKEYVGKDDLAGKHIVVISRSKLIGRPVIDKLLDLNATVFCAHSKTNLELLDEMKSKADIIITACGKPNSFWLNDNYKKGLLIVDAGINVVNEKVVGDWKYETLQDKEIVITANPGGVGKVTTYELFKSLCK